MKQDALSGSSTPKRPPPVIRDIELDISLMENRGQRQRRSKKESYSAKFSYLFYTVFRRCLRVHSNRYLSVPEHKLVLLTQKNQLQPYQHHINN